MTKRRFSPQQKKQRRYDEDHVLNVEYPHSFRKTWKEGVREENRSYRRKIKQTFHDIENCEDRAKSISLVKCKKLSWSVQTVRERVQAQLGQRRRRQIWGHFRQPYNSETHRQNFVAFLESIVDSNSEGSRRFESRRFAWDIRDLLCRPDPADPFFSWNSWHYEWLQSFFLDEPEWESRLENWVNSMRGCRHTL